MTLQRLKERKKLHDWYNRLSYAIECRRLDGLDTAEYERERQSILNELRTVRT
jgi:hypothetical protein